MSVYTVIDETEMRQLLERYAIGKLVSYQGISEGIENTNYFVNTTHDSYVLTIFERQSEQEIPYYLDLMAHIAKAELAVPDPIADKTGKYLQTLYNKPVALISRLDGHTVSAASVNHCRQIGTVLASIHLKTENFNKPRINKRDLNWGRDCARQLFPLLPKADAEMLETEIRYHQQHSLDNIPHGVIHADLFRDNALFEKESLSGVIDFYYACDGAYLYDLAITANDWCVDETGEFEKTRYQALIDAYQQLRPLSNEECSRWQDALRRAALRFWISRLYDKHFPRPGSVTHVKNPDFFKQILQSRITGAPQPC